MEECSKKKFKTRKNAKGWMRINLPKNRKQSCYKCTLCGFFHLTTKPSRARSDIRQYLTQGGKDAESH